MTMPDGYGAVINPPGTRRTEEVLAAAAKAGFKGSDIIVTYDGYYVPLAVLDEIENARGSDEPDDTEAEVEETEAEQTQTAADEEEPAPPKNGSTKAWSEWAAKNRGYDPEENLTRDELIERYGKEE